MCYNICVFGGIMLVYRCCSADNKAIIYGKNTHIYLEDNNYIHFFRYSQFANYFFSMWKDRLDRYLVADIPLNILNRCVGYGFYDLVDFSLGDESVMPIPEYAIPFSLFERSYVVFNGSNIPSFLCSDNIEYSKYFELLCFFGKKYNYDFDEVSLFFLQNNLDDLLENFGNKCTLSKRLK